ncbi:anti-sigma factor [Nibribacter koreensis]|uniref:Regulator of SigK n=1 Tax=Nibribacter koreensis TaxID=1084519 RepID=A0ABP8FDE5_9BACT
MNTQEYIESGILEVYAAGGLTDTERADVDRMAALHPQVKAALEEAHAALEAYALQHAQTPPAYLQDRILQQIQQLSASQASNHQDTTAPTQITDAPEAKVLSMTQAQQLARHSRLGNSMRAAAVILLLISTATNIYLFSEWKEAEQELTIAQQSVKQYAYETSQLEYRTDRTENFLAVVRDPETKAVALKGTPQHASAAAKVFWNQQTKEVFLDPASLPKAPSDKQYQLWALVDGKPVDAGVVASSSDVLLRMKTIEKAQAFAVTLEPKGGSVNPTLDAMYVMGAI